MPIQLGRIQKPASTCEPDAFLRDCHERIRTHMRAARALAIAPAGEPTISATAAELHRYFSVALPLHAQDEDDSIAPRLRAVGAEPIDAVEAMVEQHHDIHATSERLAAMWGRLVDHPDALEAIRQEMAADTTHLTTLWDAHLSLEEEVVFPLIGTALSTEAQAAAMAEMRARRG